MLQQYLPLAVLKLPTILLASNTALTVATVLTACGIETLIHLLYDDDICSHSCNSTYRLRYWNYIFSFFIIKASCVATVLTACGIETFKELTASANKSTDVATVLTACGIETRKILVKDTFILRLQQYLPLAVLKPFLLSTNITSYWYVATVLTACGIETASMGQPF